MNFRWVDSVRDTRRWFSQSEHLLRPEQIALFFLIGGLAGAEWLPVIGQRVALTPADGVGFFMALSLGLYAFSPVVATFVVGIVALISFLMGVAGSSVLGVVVASLLVARLGAPRLLLIYTAGLAVYFAAMLLSADTADVLVGDILVWVIGAAALGFGLRFAVAGGQREQEERRKEAIAAERVWLANELHDGIAHHLTIASLHSQLLDDETQRPMSQKIVQDAVGNALTDLRFIINLSEDTSAEVEQQENLQEAFVEAMTVIEASGNRVVLQGDLTRSAMPTRTERALCRMMRECATNIVKYAGRGTVYIRLETESEYVVLEVRSPLSEGPPRVDSSTGTGIKAMSARARRLNGSFSAGPDKDEWVVYMRLPIPFGDTELKAAHPGMRA